MPSDEHGDDNAEGPVLPASGEPSDVAGGEVLASEPDDADRPGRAGRRTAVVTAVALALAAGGGALAIAAGGHGGHGAPGGAAAPGAPGGPGIGPEGSGQGNGQGNGEGSGAAPGGPGRAGAPGGGRGPGGARGPGGDVVHGTFVVPAAATASGASQVTETDDLQHGTVTAVGGGSLAVRSADGFAATYALGSSAQVDGGSGAIGEVQSGDTVVLVARVGGATATVTTLVHRTRATAGPGTSGSGTRGGPPPLGAGRGGDLLVRALHGSYVAATTTGTSTTYAAHVVQTGDVTALSATSVSVRSTDGVVATYAITSATAKDSSVATGSTATVVATGTTATSLRIARTAGKRPGPTGGEEGGVPPQGGWEGGATPEGGTGT